MTSPSRRPVAFANRLGSMDAHERDRIVGDIEARLPPASAELGMPAADVQALVSAGFEVGFHTLRHPVLTSLDDEALRDAMAAGREQLTAAAGSPLTTIAYPHGEADERVVRAAAAAGFTAGFTTMPEPLRPESDRLRVGRIYAPATNAGFALGVARALLSRP
jgi:peptidoglycan/xylan/chitin deacetylase (PgdA/CDA1 family)